MAYTEVGRRSAKKVILERAGDRIRELEKGGLMPEARRANELELSVMYDIASELEWGPVMRLIDRYREELLTKQATR